jgi:hypothetical protein
MFLFKLTHYRGHGLIEKLDNSPFSEHGLVILDNGVMALGVLYAS